MKLAYETQARRGVGDLGSLRKNLSPEKARSTDNVKGLLRRPHWAAGVCGDLFEAHRWSGYHGAWLSQYRHVGPSS